MVEIRPLSGSISSQLAGSYIFEYLNSVRERKREMAWETAAENFFMCFSGYRPRSLCGAAAQSGRNHVIYLAENILPIIDMEKSTKQRWLSGKIWNILCILTWKLTIKRQNLGKSFRLADVILLHLHCWKNSRIIEMMTTLQMSSDQGWQIHHRHLIKL